MITYALRVSIQDDGNIEFKMIRGEYDNFCEYDNYELWVVDNINIKKEILEKEEFEKLIKISTDKSISYLINKAKNPFSRYYFIYVNRED